ncbi:hypothetical protein P280DRAFT_543604 [Massarina eburnea CBS 473.64]|uniref:Uncharacterized protein n=1 Tax=Massarina eburnea CBS 473.64 TaxID=1395130 RepID=A0A6A6S316_9PLEO|nr:hypothetical protein P280DRAFT_543604 [Massarina eburnea CBS 473.64]
MLSKAALALAATLPLGALASSNVTFTETIEGYTFIKSGPKPESLAPKINYEWEAAQIALNLLKTSLGPDGMLTTLALAITEADTFWKNIAEISTGKIGTEDGWVSADGQGVAFLPNVTAQRFVQWYLSPLADTANNEANPEHYFKRTTVVGSTAQSDILEGWGGITTHFTVPNFSMPPNATRYPFIHSHGTEWITAAGDKALMDGTVFGVLQIAARDVTGSDYNQTMNGVHIWASVWYGDAVKDEHLEDERKHMTTEIINLTLQAQKDIESGKLVVS